MPTARETFLSLATAQAAFDEVLSSSESPADIRQQQFCRLALLLTARCVTEENVAYPALGEHGTQSDSHTLYLDQAHAKVMNAVFDIADDKGSAGWLEKAQELKEAVFMQAKEDAEADLYPRLQAELNATASLKLGAAYRRVFLTIKSSLV